MPFLSYEFNGRVVASFDSLNSAPPGPGVYVVTEYSRGAAIEGPYVTGRQIHSNYASWHHPVGAALYPGAIAQFTGTTVWQVVIEARRPVFVMDEGGGYHFIGYESWLIETAIETPRSAANYIYIP